MQRVNPHIFRVILLTIMLANSLLASATMTCEMKMPDTANMFVSDNMSEMDHSKMASVEMMADMMSTTDVSAIAMDCCDGDCTCEMGCISSLALPEAGTIFVNLPSPVNISDYITAIPTAVQGKIFHPPIRA